MAGRCICPFSFPPDPSVRVTRPIENGRFALSQFPLVCPDIGAIPRGGLSNVRKMRMGAVGSSSSGRRFERLLNDAARAIRQHLDTTKVLRAAVEAAHPMLGSRRSSAWLTNGKAMPRLAHAID